MSYSSIRTQIDKENLLSFIIPYYNVPIDMLKTCIDSILCLSLNPQKREIILIDDGSDTSPLPHLQAYADKLIYIRLPHTGLSNARNTGIRISTGKYIQFIDADDFLLQTPYEHCLDIMRYHHPDIVFFDFTKTYTTNLPLNFEGPIDGTQYMRQNNLKASACGYLFNRKILGDLRFRPKIYHEDEEFTPQLLLRAERVFTTNAKAYYYRLRNESITRKKDLKNTIKRLTDMESIIKNLRRMADIATQENREALQRRVAQLTMDYLYNVILQTHSLHYLEKCVNRLYMQGLFPLPDKPYTRKYKWFRRLIAHKWGRKLLCKLLPALPK